MMAQLERGELLGLSLEDSLPSGGGNRQYKDDQTGGYITELFEKPERPQGFILPEPERPPLPDESGLRETEATSPYKGVATEDERWNRASPPGGDYDHYTWIPTMGWIYTGSEKDGTAGKSSYINDQGQRVHHDPVNTFKRDSVWWDMKRPLVFGESAWIGGGDLYNLEGGRYNRKTNPYVYTDEMRARDLEREREHAAQFYYDPETNLTHIGGKGSRMTMKGPPRTLAVEDMTPEQREYHDSNQRYYEGHSQFTDQGRKYMQQAGMKFSNPFADVFSQDVNPLLDAFASDDWNPFYGTDRQNIIDRQREIGILSDQKTAYENRTKGNIMDYMYKALSGIDQAKNRRKMFTNWNEYLESKGLDHRNMYNVRMNERLFNQLGMGEFGLEYDPDLFKGTAFDTGPIVRSGFAGGNPLMNSGGMMSDKMAGDKQPLPQIQANNGGFLDSYLRQRANRPPSVMSLMDEMKDF